ncbi:MAG: CCA tRNA nucleotidyltransferase, partial [Brevinema sp.]
HWSVTNLEINEVNKLFKQAIPEDIFFISDIFSKRQFELRLVGGAVRDSLRGDDVSDFDLATSASPSQMIELFKSYPQCHLIPTGLAHGTLTLVLNKKHYEITTYRIDGGYSNNRHPDQVLFTNSLEQDLSRRDFTINAIAVDPISKEIIDPFNGQQDIAQKIITTVGDPEERFQEDALRMLRACRFAAKLEYTITKKTFSAIKKHASMIQNISKERLRDELLKILASNKPSIGIELIRSSGLLKYIIPELEEGFGMDQNEFHKFDVYWHNLKTCDAFNDHNDSISRLAALLHDIGKPRAKKFALKIGNGNVFYNHEIIGAKMTKNIMRRLKFSNQEIDTAVLLVELHMFYYTTDWADGAIRRFLRRFDGDMIFLAKLFKLREADRLGSGTKKQSPSILREFKSRIDKILEFDAALKVKDLDINGDILITRFNLSPSPIIGEILNYLLELVLDNPEINTKDQLLKEVELYISNNK